jgi:transposase-like protein
MVEKEQSKASGAPKTLLDAITYFSSPSVAFQFMAAIRWPNGPICPKCESTDILFLKNRQLWKCRECKKQFSVKVGTIFEDSPIKLEKWLPALWMLSNCKNGISSYELGRALGVTQKTAWFMLHRIRLAMQTESFQKMDGEVEVDETFIGGKARNMHWNKRKAKGSGSVGKVAVMGLLARHGEGGSKIRTKVIRNVRSHQLVPEVWKNVEVGAEVFTDAFRSYGRTRGGIRAQGHQPRRDLRLTARFTPTESRTSGAF